MLRQYEFVNNLPGLFLIKDTNSIIRSMSKNYAMLAGWENEASCCGMTDYDIRSEAVESASEFIKYDQKVLASGKKMITLEIQKYTQGWKLILLDKNPIKDDNGKIIGLFLSSIDVSHAASMRAYLKIHQDSRYTSKTYHPAIYTLNEDHHPLPLTEKQENCLFLLIRGKSIKEIAKILALSPRTIESHLDAIKYKLNCNSKAEIIEKAIDSGFLYYIPKGMALNKL